ncbi:potassium transporter Kup [Neogemmobacter tilapiae]|uniref:Probable potassium transport system protein Kup n=1 Tax=Neogemmobacter tilapiae TaxID=875041 RepID=A0A918TYB1_9RHOB|nr:potassium transporter Kup [Gemmobacter tilapiae]GHC64405.1 putative potassium transport system protein kup [Gemmobacter tilapiae]
MTDLSGPLGPVSGPEARADGVDDTLDISGILKEGPDTDFGHVRKQGLAALTLGAVGVVYGDIGTSPIYAFREAVRPLAGDGLVRAEVLGILSLLIWTLILIVTLKYVLFLLRLDNKGEGGILTLYTLARLAIGKRSIPVLLLGIAGAALFAGDAIITPAISVLSAVEGAGLVLPDLEHWVVPVTLGILLALFFVQKHGTASISLAFGPITAVWFLTLAGLGLWNMAANPDVLNAFNPIWAGQFLIEHSGVAFIVLGAVFLAVTGAEALYADLGHFGRKPIALAWFLLVFPALVLNYLGQGALVMARPETISDPFFLQISEGLLPFLVLLATIATVIASQAVITGAFSMVQAAMQLGLLPRMTVRHTSHGQSGQIYIASINWMLLLGVVWLVLTFDTSSALASAYGISVTGTMVVTTILAIIYLVRSGRLSLFWTLAMALPILALEVAFLASNLTKIVDGGYIPVFLALCIGLIMWAWWRGTQFILARVHQQSVALEGFVKSMQGSSVHVIPGTAFYLTADPTVVPSALLHNLKHNRVLHSQNVFLTVETLRVPVAEPEERVEWQALHERFSRLTLRFGFMETPNVSRALPKARRAGLKFDVMTSSFFLGRKRPVVDKDFGLPRFLDSLYAQLARMAADPTDYFHLPRVRVVEMGEQVKV